MVVALRQVLLVEVQVEDLEAVVLAEDPMVVILAEVQVEALVDDPMVVILAVALVDDLLVNQKLFFCFLSFCNLTL